MRTLILVGNRSAYNVLRSNVQVAQDIQFTENNTWFKYQKKGSDGCVMVYIWQAHWMETQKLRGFDFDLVHFHESFAHTQEFKDFINYAVLRR